MKLKEVKQHLAELDSLIFNLPDGESVPEHFHVTEVGLVKRNFIDCGGTIRNEKAVNFQLWTAEDVDHRLEPSKLKNIILLSEEKLGISEDLEVEVEYQGNTIGKYHLDFADGKFILQTTLTDCLAKDSCGIPQNEMPKKKPKMKLSELQAKTQACSPNSGCC
jgi:hypothetical protein